MVPVVNVPDEAVIVPLIVNGHEVVTPAELLISTSLHDMFAILPLITCAPAAPLNVSSPLLFVIALPEAVIISPPIFKSFPLTLSVVLVPMLRSPVIVMSTVSVFVFPFVTDRL